MLENTTEKNKRILFWDNLKGILIALVVFAHCLYGYQDHLYIGFLVLAIYYVHMPAFVFASGYFSKSEHARSKEAAIKLLLSYVFLISIYIFSDVKYGKTPHILSTYQSEWYLMALVLWRLMVPKLVKNKWIIPILVGFSLIVGYWPDFGGNTTLSINKVVTFLPFFGTGYLINKEFVMKLRSRKTFKLIGHMLLWVVFVSILVSYRFLGVRMIDVLPQAYETCTVGCLVRRLVVFSIASCFIIGILAISPDRRIPILTKAGKNSFSIFLIHRPLTVLFDNAFAQSTSKFQVYAAVGFTIMALIILGSDEVSNKLNGFLDECVNALIGHKKRKLKVGICLFMGLVFTFPVIVGIIRTQKSEEQDKATKDRMYRVISEEKEEAYHNAFKILFCGDLILLEDQVRKAYNGSEYDFNPAFEYTKSYLSEADYSIGVFEGPLGGTIRNYSSSNYDDGKELYINFPDEWADAVKNAGFDLVTLANNHILDMGVEGKNRTIEVLREKGLDYVGAYRDDEDKINNRVKMVEKDGLRMAILSYTYGANYKSTKDLISGSLACATSLIVDPTSSQYNMILEEVRNDFDTAKTMEPDLIIVLPHWGTQFSDVPDQFQRTWEQNFKEFGADIILGDHTHSVQPVKIDDKGVLTLYCPGNYANIYREYNGDCSSLVEVYVDRTSRKVIGGSVIPMWTVSSLIGNYRAIPIYKIMTDKELGNMITTYDLERIKEAQKHISKIMLGEEIDIDLLQERYYFDTNGFMRTKAKEIDLDELDVNEALLAQMSEARKICFVGDSITEGTKNGGVPWYEPLESIIGGEIENCGWGGATTKTLLHDHLDQIVESNADLYVFAIGTNDVRYQNKESAKTSEEYLANLQRLKDAILEKTPNARFVFIAPWTSTDGDRVSKLQYNEKMRLNDEYSVALRDWCLNNGDIFINANPYIEEYLKKYPQSNYLIDYIHPNYQNGVALYAKAFLSRQE